MIFPRTQRTLKTVVEIEGEGLFTGWPVKMRCLPGEADTGLVFVRTDLPDTPEIPCAIPNLVTEHHSAARATAVQNGEAQVMMIEHIMSSLFGLGIDNLRVEINSPEMPAGDGSAMTYVEPFLQAGTTDLDAPIRGIHVSTPVTVTRKDVMLVALPSEEGLTVTYVLDYGEKFFGCQVLTLTLDERTFIEQIAPARTYCLRPEIDFFVKQGLGKGATAQNTIVVEEDGGTSDDLRFPDECVRHKILDLLGDLFLAGRLGPCRLLGYKSGHETNVLLARELAEVAR